MISPNPFAQAAFLRVVLGVVVGFKCAVGAFAQDSSKPVTAITELILYAPGAQGGGYDRAAQALRRALLDAELVEDVAVVHSPGAGGLLGVSEFLRTESGNPNAVLLGGRSNIGASAFNKSSVSLSDTVPIASLYAASIAIAVPDASPVRNLEALLGAFRDDPDAVKWVGGSAGSQDELLLFEIARALHVDRRSLDYRPVPGGGDDVIALALSGQADVVLSSPEELADALRAGSLRLLATSHQMAGRNSPVLADIGIEGVSPDWRGVFAAPGLDADEVDCLDTLFQTLAETDSWQAELRSNGWTAQYAHAHDFQDFIARETRAVAALQTAASDGAPINSDLARVVGRPYRWLPLAGLLIAVLLGAVLLQRLLAQRRTSRLETDLDALKAEMDKRVSGACEHIESEFDSWRLTASEREVGWLLLKGLSFREVSAARGTSERTARQQARAVYAKSGLGSRSDLSAYFFEDFVFGMQSGSEAMPAN